jgi:hypothetical protein
LNQIRFFLIVNEPLAHFPISFGWDEKRGGRLAVLWSQFDESGRKNRQVLNVRNNKGVRPKPEVNVIGLVRNNEATGAAQTGSTPSKCLSEGSKPGV